MVTRGVVLTSADEVILFPSIAYFEAQALPLLACARNTAEYYFQEKSLVVYVFFF